MNPDVRTWLETRGFGQYADLFDAHRIDSKALAALTEQHLHEMGLQAADRWLAANRSAVGKRSTVDLSGLAPPKDSLLTRPSLREQAQLSTSDATARSA